MIEFLHNLQMELDGKYKKRQRDKNKYLKTRAAAFERHTNGEITLDEYKTEVAMAAKRHLHNE